MTDDGSGSGSGSAAVKGGTKSSAKRKRGQDKADEDVDDGEPESKRQKQECPCVEEKNLDCFGCALQAQQASKQLVMAGYHPISTALAQIVRRVWRYELNSVFLKTYLTKDPSQTVWTVQLPTGEKKRATLDPSCEVGVLRVMISDWLPGCERIDIFGFVDSKEHKFDGLCDPLLLGSDEKKLSSFHLRMDQDLIAVRHCKGQFTVNVRTLTGKETKIAVNPDDKVYAIKLALQMSEGIPVCQCRLVHAGSQLADGNKVSVYKLQQDSMIHLIIRLGGS